VAGTSSGEIPTFAEGNMDLGVRSESEDEYGPNEERTRAVLGGTSSRKSTGYSYKKNSNAHSGTSTAGMSKYKKRNPRIGYINSGTGASSVAGLMKAGNGVSSTEYDGTMVADMPGSGVGNNGTAYIEGHSIGNMVLPYFTFPWKNEHLIRYMAVQFSLPSGIIPPGELDLEGRVHLSVTDDFLGLKVMLEWPECMSNADLVKKSILRNKHSLLRNSMNMACFLHAFNDRMSTMKRSQGLSQRQSLGSTTVIPLATLVEGTIVEIASTCCVRTSGIAVLVLLKEKEQEENEHRCSMQMNLIGEDDDDFSSATGSTYHSHRPNYRGPSTGGYRDTPSKCGKQTWYKSG
jgi:hypothetical protein